MNYYELLRYLHRILVGQEGGCPEGVCCEIQRLFTLVPQMQEELAKANTETALLRKAYEELAESKSKLEAQKAKLVNELADRDAVLSFLWDKMFPAK